MTEQLGIDDVTERLGVKRETVYAYVSRGLLRSALAPDGRRSTFDAAEVEALAARSRPRRRPRRGEGIDAALTSAVTELGDGRINYRGTPLEELVAQRLPFEAVAELLWTGVRPSPWTSGPLDGAGRTAGCRPARRRRARTHGHTHRSASGGRGGRGGGRPAASRPPPRCGPALRPPSAGRGDRRPCHPTTPAAPTSPATPTTPADSSIAAMLAQAIDRRLPRRWHQPIDLALVCLADHELATSTLAARVAASVRADPTAVVLAGLATLSGPLHGSASVAVQRLLATASDAGAPSAAVADRLRSDGHLPGFGHLVHRHGDPRFTGCCSMPSAGRRAPTPAAPPAWPRSMRCWPSPPSAPRCHPTSISPSALSATWPACRWAPPSC
ncbi:MAG: citrate/2-methylcitrate synthase [Acidimicrobiales bacterium]